MSCNCDDIIIEAPVEEIIIEVTPEGADGNGIASIELLSTVGRVKTYRIHFTDGTHYDYQVSDGAQGDPGPAGKDGKDGVSIVSVYKTGQTGLVDEYTILLSNGHTDTFTVTNGAPGTAATIAVGTVTTLPAGSPATVENAGTSSAARFDFGIPQGPQGEPGASTWGDITGDIADQADLQAALNSKADIIHSTASGSIVTITDGAPLPVDSLSVAVEPVQDLHGQPYPYPAGGGKNIGKISSSNEGSGQKSTAVYSDTGVTLTTTGTYGRQGWLFDVTEGQQYTVSYKVVGTGWRVYYGTADGVWSSSSTGYLDFIAVSTTLTSRSYTFTATSSGTFFFGLYCNSGSYDSENPQYITVTDFQLERGSSATSFAPYENICPISGSTQTDIYHDDEYDADADPVITVVFGQTVYGANLNVLTGELTVTDDQISSYAGETLPGAWISDRDAYAPGETPTIGAQVVYKVSTPTVIQLTAQQMSTLLGQNAVWASTGNTQLGYRADTKTYIDQHIAQTALATRSMITGVESAMKATKNYTSGALIIVGDDLYKATANIANGATLTVGTNVTKVTLAEYILSVI